MLSLCPSEGQQQWQQTSQRQKCVTSHRIPFNPGIRGDRVPDYTEICLRSGTGLLLNETRHSLGVMKWALYFKWSVEILY